MKANEYQQLAMRTNDKKATDRLTLKASQVIVSKNGMDFGGILNACLGLSGETGELNDIIKKWIFHQKPLDQKELCKELGDILWYCAMLCEAFNWDMEEVMEQNIEKLKKRYPEGFDIERANGGRENE
jgi:NTP pyrophosphatase (non-canonical NTP hydrolase)